MFNRARCCITTGLFSFGLLISTGCGTTPSVLISPSSAVLLPGQTFQFNVNRIGNSATDFQPQPLFLVNGIAGGSPSTGTITPDGLFTAPAVGSAQQITVGIRGSSSSAAVTIFNQSNFASGSVAATQNPLVASYSITVPAGTSVQVQFGLDTNYGYPTSFIQTQTGGQVTVLVAGMRAGTLYHMQAIANLINGSQLLDADQTFTTGTIPAERLPNMTAQQFGNSSLSPGVELFSLSPDTVGGDLLSTVATDLQGNVIWYYDLESTDFPFPVKPLPNGHMLVLTAPVDITGPNEIREIDLAGNIIQRVTLDEVNHAIQGTFQVSAFSHDVEVLPDGHWILLASYSETAENIPGIPAGTVMLGDALIDWDLQRGTAAWTWSAFDHLDRTREPYGFADWTHGNAVIYSPDDGDLILSLRNQNWILKINYQNGAGDGSVLWRLGPQGDFSLPAAEEPIEWNYGQHYPTIVSPNSAGVFSLMFFNNGNNRVVDHVNGVCGYPTLGPCYSSVPIFQLDESAKTATVLWEDNLLPFYSLCCGDALILANGDVEFDVADNANSHNVSYIEEVTPSKDLVWKMAIEGQLAYRGFRIPSLYPGQIWPATTPSDSNRAPLHPLH